MKFSYYLALFPYAIAIILFYSLALHMHNELGGWPESIGTRGFSENLLLHVNIQGWYLSNLALITAFVVPFIILICGLVKKWRFLVPYLLIQIVGLIVFLLQMNLAPSEYVYWFWD